MPETTHLRARRAVLAMLGGAALFFSNPNLAHACACCAEDGERREGTSALRPYELEELAKIRFAKAARLYLNAAGFDLVHGIDGPSDSYQMTHATNGGVWTFTFRDGRGRAGTLAFTLPSTVDYFFVDQRDARSGGGGPILYKEWRLSGPLTATGIFKPTMSGNPTVRLVLQGRGNDCTSADQFTHWTLIVSGPKANYRLFGALAPASAKP